MVHSFSRCMVKRVTIASGSAFFREGNRVWLPPIEFKSLRQWWEFLDEVALAKPQLAAERPPEGWMEVPAGIKVYRLCGAGDGRIKRHLDSLHAARELLKPQDVLVARMPYYESAWCYKVGRKKGMRCLVEIHGDWETAVLEEDASSLFRRATRRFRAQSNRRMVSEMSANAICVLGVGPRLLEKYVPSDVPSLASTNHLLSEECYVPRHDFALKNPPRILFVGDMQRRKGLHILFQALSKLSDAGQRFEMVMVGSGPMVEELTAYASRQGFAKNVRFVGKVPHGQALYAFFRESDLFVLPSVAAEGVPRVTHEAMAFGCPVIATDIGSVAWQLQGGAGLVVPSGCIEHLAQAMSQVLNDEEQRRSLSEKGYLRSLEYTYEKQQTTIAEFVRAHLDG